jgi:hypothetical protein
MESKDYIKKYRWKKIFRSEVRAVVVDGEVRAVDGYAAKFNSPTTIECIILLSKRSSWCVWWLS